MTLNKKAFEIIVGEMQKMLVITIFSFSAHVFYSLNPFPNDKF